MFGKLEIALAARSQELLERMVRFHLTTPVSLERRSVRTNGFPQLYSCISSPKPRSDTGRPPYQIKSKGRSPGSGRFSGALTFPGLPVVSQWRRKAPRPSTVAGSAVICAPGLGLRVTFPFHQSRLGGFETNTFW